LCIFVEPPPPGVSNGASLEYSRRVLGSALDSINHSRPRRYWTSDNTCSSVCYNGYQYQDHGKRTTAKTRSL